MFQSLLPLGVGELCEVADSLITVISNFFPPHHYQVFQSLLPLAVGELCEVADSLITPVRLGVARPTAPFPLVSASIDAVQGSEELFTADPPPLRPLSTDGISTSSTFPHGNNSSASLGGGGGGGSGGGGGGGGGGGSTTPSSALGHHHHFRSSVVGEAILYSMFCYLLFGSFRIDQFILLFN